MGTKKPKRWAKQDLGLWNKHGDVFNTQRIFMNDSTMIVTYTRFPTVPPEEMFKVSVKRLKHILAGTQNQDFHSGG